MCKIIDEEILPEKEEGKWEIGYVDLAYKSITYPAYSTTIFDDLFKNLENNPHRMDIVVTFQDQRFVIEVKVWYGEEYHQRGLKQLSNYLDTYSKKEGYLLVFDFNVGKKYHEEMIHFDDKQIFTIWV
jgi:hypothetical protein